MQRGDERADRSAVVSQIKHLYQLQGMAPKMVEELTKRHGPMCEKCLDEWRQEQANTKK